MSFARLYEFAAGLGQLPIRVSDVVPVVKELMSQDEVYFTAVELDPTISLGHIKQYRESTGVYSADPLWITDIRYEKALNICWKRFVCCKELMHVFDTQEERSNSAERFARLLKELEAPPLAEQASEMYFSENRTQWKALAILCPLPVREHYIAKRAAGEMQDDYDVALELRIPKLYVPTILGEDFPQIVKLLADLA